ncbi:winged helix-turn-helix domain-containing protein [Streptosporangium sp. NPDC000239]|uniref:Winged helix-turn-helix domain-containing protein n=1 Tax=Streptosporangium jomthongense TaxID=1193683 RepID=A0ABV8ES11_9ACTN
MSIRKLSGILVQRGEQVLELAPGEHVTFGRGAVDLVLPDLSVSRLAGRIDAVDDYWTISNLSRRSTYVVDTPEGDGEFVRVPAGRMRAPIPFELGRVRLSGDPSGGMASFLVFAPEHVLLRPDAPRRERETAQTVPLDATATYFLILVALCEPRLRDPLCGVVPTIPEIIIRLAHLGLGRSAVNFHIDYLARVKLQVRMPERPVRPDWRRVALVSLALRHDLVTTEHLALLETRSHILP